MLSRNVTDTRQGRLDHTIDCDQLETQWSQFLSGHNGALLWSVWSDRYLYSTMGFVSQLLISKMLVVLTLILTVPSVAWWHFASSSVTRYHTS